MSQRGLWKGMTVFLSVFLVLFAVSNAFGSGFAIYTQGASSLGQGNATIAHTEDPSAIFFNPALINKLDKTQIELGTTIIFPSRKFKSDLTGKTLKADEDVFYPSTLFVTHKFNEKLSAGLGVFNPFGLATKWPDDWEGRFITTNSEMQTYNINPVVSYQITPHIAFAAGVDFLFLDATLEKKINLFSSGEAGQKFEGDGNGVGYNFGILIEPHKDISIGASYRSEIKVDIDGNATFDLPTPLLNAVFPNTTGNTDLTLPQQVHFGIYYEGFYPLTFEVAARWEGWSSFDRLEVKLDKPVGPTKETVFITKRNWKDTWSGNIGIKYQVSDMLALLAGYLYQGNPVPDATFDPSIPDANGHLFSIGADVKHKSLRFGLAYSYQKLQVRNKNNSVDDDPTDGIIDPTTTANGKYKSSLHMVGISLTYKF
jgi:long-chain fatty acid transport protein